MRETLSKRPRTMVKTRAKTAKTKIAETRTQAKLRPASKPKTASTPKSSVRSAAKGKTGMIKSAKTTPKTSVTSKAAGKETKALAKKTVATKTAAKRNESPVRAKSKDIKVKTSASAKPAATAKQVSKRSVVPTVVPTVQPGKTSAKPRRKIVLPIKVAPPPPPAPPRRVPTTGAVRAFEHAVRVFNRRQFEEAKPLFETLLAKYSGEVEIIARAQMYLQVCAQKLDHAQSAPRNADELYDRGVYALNIGDFSQAKSFFEKALRLKPEEPYLLYSLAATHAQTGAMDQALDYLKRTFQIQPRYRTQALHDSDFSGLRENKRFLELLGLASPFDLLQSRR